MKVYEKPGPLSLRVDDALDVLDKRLKLFQYAAHSDLADPEDTEVMSTAFLLVSDAVQDVRRASDAVKEAIMAEKFNAT